MNWLQVDLKQQAVINRVKIYNRRGSYSVRLRDATIEISDSEDMTQSKQLCASFSSITTESQIENFNCIVPMIGRYVRLTQRNINETYLNIPEMQVWGYFN